MNSGQDKNWLVLGSQTTARTRGLSRGRTGHDLTHIFMGLLYSSCRAEN